MWFTYSHRLLSFPFSIWVGSDRLRNTIPGGHRANKCQGQDLNSELPASKHLFLLPQPSSPSCVLRSQEPMTLPGNWSHLFMFSSGSRDDVSPKHTCLPSGGKGKSGGYVKCRVLNYRICPRIILHCPVPTCLICIFFLGRQWRGSLPCLVVSSTKDNERGTGSRATGFPALGRQAPLWQEVAACSVMGWENQGFPSSVLESDRVRQKPRAHVSFFSRPFADRWLTGKVYSTEKQHQEETTGGI